MRPEDAGIDDVSLAIDIFLSRRAGIPVALRPVLPTDEGVLTDMLSSMDAFATDYDRLAVAPGLSRHDRLEQTAALLSRISPAMSDLLAEVRRRSAEVWLGKQTDLLSTARILSLSTAAMVLALASVGAFAIVQLRLAQRRNEALASLSERVAEARAEAEAANQAKTTFLANMSHELRTPLNAIMGFSEIMVLELMGPHSNVRYKEYAGDIHDSAAHLSTLVDSVLDLSQIEAGRRELEVRLIDLGRVARAALSMVEGRAIEQGVRLVSVLAPAIRIESDETVVRQIMINLLANAVKFTPSGGSITLRVESGSYGGAVFRVEDTGIGMAPEDLNRALQPFVQLEGPLQKRHQGVGLGLHIVQTLVASLGGTLALESDPGKGTRVIVALPSQPKDHRARGGGPGTLPKPA